ncbi:MAG: SpoIVB peptidase, partial [Lachnospiraceae bacterium]|nr:SpoIVB peptidase [Lachnospiraceae bacterium]
GIPLSLEKTATEDKTATLASMVFEKNSVGAKTKDSHYTVSCKMFGILPLKEIYVEEKAEQTLIPGGMPVGIYVKTKGVLVIGTSPIVSAGGDNLEPAKYLLKSGDYILSVNGEKISTKEELIDKVNQYGKEKLTLGLDRNGEEIELALEAVMTPENSYKIGVWVRDDLAGVGTMTFTDAQGNYGALGHGVSDADTSTLIDMEKGLLYQTDIIGIVKGEKGVPGELTGVINYSSQYCLGSVDGNTRAGVYGELNEIPPELSNVEALPVGYKQEVEHGKAEIICTLKGERKSYEIEITETNFHTSEANKGIQFTVSDKELLSATGGIVQGMSGSPIIQNGKLIGAVTHVFVQDASKGYGIFAENMLKEMEAVKK